MNEVLLGVGEGLAGGMDISPTGLETQMHTLGFGRGKLTFCTWEFHLRAPTRTLTVFCMRPADTTTPWSSRVTRFAAAVNGLSMVRPSRGVVGMGWGSGCRRLPASM